MLEAPAECILVFFRSSASGFGCELHQIGGTAVSNPAVVLGHSLSFSLLFLSDF